MSLRIIVTVLLLFYAISAASAETSALIVRGKVLEEGTRKPLEGMTVYITERDMVSAVSDRDGRFALEVDSPGAFTVIAAAIGYEKSKPVAVYLSEAGKSEELVLFIKPLYSLGEVLVQAERNKDKTAKTIVTGDELASMAGSAGNPMRALQALPGVTTANDRRSAPALRGSAPYNNAYYIDFMPVGYLGHALGLDSVINGGLIKDVNIFTSSCGPGFNATGGVVDMQLRDPRKDRMGGMIDINILRASALLEGPTTGNQSFFFGARRSYLDLIIPKEDFGGEPGVEFRKVPRYYDFQGKYVWKLSDDHSLTISMSGAEDSMKLTYTADSNPAQREPILAGDSDFEKSYRTFGAVLFSRISDGMNNKLGISRFDSNQTQQWTQLGHSIIYRESFIIRDQLNMAASENHDLFLGIEYDFATFHIDFDTAKIVASEWILPPDFTSAERITLDKKPAVNTGILGLKDRWKMSEPITVVIGAQASFDDYLNKRIVEPKLSAEYDVQKDTLVTAAWGRYHQYPDFSMIVDGLGNPRLGYEKTDQSDLGIERKLTNGWTVKLEEYYKKMYDLAVPSDPENFINGGSGKAYGTELSIKKQDRSVNWGGWLSVAYSRSVRHNDVTGESFPSTYDQPLIINIVYSWKISPRWTFGARWRYQSGAPFTPVIGTYTDGTGRIRPVYGSLNSDRLPDYNRLDLKISSEKWRSDRQKLSWYVDIINASNRKNIAGYSYNKDFTSRTPITDLSFLPVLGMELAF